MSEPNEPNPAAPSGAEKSAGRTRRRGKKKKSARRAAGGAAPPRGTIGPVSDLERHLPADWWRSLFTSLYLKTDGDVVEHDENTTREVDLLIRAAALEPNDRILDLCCGQGRHCLELARRGFRHVTGVDRSRYLIRLARRRAKQAGLSVSFHEGDARRFRVSPHTFQCVALMGNSFGYFDREEDDEAVLRAVLRALVPGGLLVMDLSDGEWMRANFDPRSWEWIDENHFVCRERSLSADASRLVTREVVVHAERGVIADQFYAERLYSRERIGALLEDVGFTSVRQHEAVQTASERGQDLGMMAHRMFLTAQSPPRAVIAAEPAHVRTITVILGDPTIPDRVKRDGQFNPEDYDTVERLKRALGELGGYEFRYLDHHATLLSELRANPPEFVLNFCDEGYNNEPFMELHVPAVLEMLGVPYTGGGPACLGICFNKSYVRAIAETIDVPVPAETYFDPADQAATLPAGFPVLVKPNYGDSSVGITRDAVVHSPRELLAYFQSLRDELPGVPILAQEYLTGPEYSVGIVGNPGVGFRVLPVLEVDYSRLDPDLPRICGYESKWLPDSPFWKQITYRAADLDDETTRLLADHSTLLFERLGCRDYARFDYRADARGTIRLLEANPNPGWCWDGKLNLMAECGGLRYADLLELIIRAAQDRVAATTAAERLVPAG